MIIQNNQTKEELGSQELGELTSFFDLLARFDCEDKQKEKSKLCQNPDLRANRLNSPYKM